MTMTMMTLVMLLHPLRPPILLSPALVPVLQIALALVFVIGKFLPTFS